MSPSTRTDARRRGRPGAGRIAGGATGRAARARASHRTHPCRAKRLSLLADEAGTALVEFAMVGSLLLMLALGVIEYGNVFSDVHTLTSLSREGANLAARGATLTEVIATVLGNGGDIALPTHGGAVATRIGVRGGAATVDQQEASPGFAGRSRLGGVGGPASGVGGWNLQEGQTVYVVELFYRYDTITPLRSVVGIAVPDTLYERGIF
jgi:hypothetical protein